MRFYNGEGSDLFSQGRVRAWPTLPVGDTFESDMEPLPGTAIAEDGESVYVEAALPGIEPHNIEVTFDAEEEVLWIRGERREAEEKDKKYYYKTFGNFSYRIALPEAVVKTVETTAVSKNGLLTVKLAKLPRGRPSKLEIAIL